MHPIQCKASQFRIDWPSVKAGGVMSSITRITIASGHATHCWNCGSATQLHSTRHNTCTLLRKRKTSHAFRQVQDNKAQVHYPDQRYILMMLYIAQT